MSESEATMRPLTIILVLANKLHFQGHGKCNQKIFYFFRIIKFYRKIFELSSARKSNKYTQTENVCSETLL